MGKSVKEIGRTGGNRTLKKYGKLHFSELALKSWSKRGVPKYLLAKRDEIIIDLHKQGYDMQQIGLMFKLNRSTILRVIR